MCVPLTHTYSTDFETIREKVLSIDSTQSQREHLFHNLDTFLLLVHGRFPQYQLSEENQTLSDGGVWDKDLSQLPRHAPLGIVLQSSTGWRGCKF